MGELSYPVTSTKEVADTINERLQLLRFRHPVVNQLNDQQRVHLKFNMVEMQIPC